MEKTKEGKFLNNKFKWYIWGVIILFVTTIFFIFIFSALILFLQLDRAFASAFATVSVCIGTLFGSYFTALKIGDKGYKIGFYLGLLSYVLITVVSLFFDKQFTLNTAFHFIIIILGGIVGGILGINKKAKRNYI